MIVGLKNTIPFLLALLSFTATFAQSKTALEAIDEFYDHSSSAEISITSSFTDKAMINSITYDDNGDSKVNSFQVVQFENAIKSLDSVFNIHQEPVVLLSQKYGGLETFFCSIYTRLINRKTQDTINLRSVQSIQLVFENGWKIQHLLIQNENTNNPIGEDLWPNELTSSVKIGALYSAKPTSSNSFETYDPTKVYNSDEVDETPVYPGKPADFNALLNQYTIVTAPSDDYTPFTIEIQEDGLAELRYVGDLSSSQIDKAKSFVNSMFIWYPAIKDAASVRCKLIMYIR